MSKIDAFVNYNYIKKELENIGGDYLKIKVTSENGQTKWISLDDHSFNIFIVLFCDRYRQNDIRL